MKNFHTFFQVKLVTYCLSLRKAFPAFETWLFIVLSLSLSVYPYCAGAALGPFAYLPHSQILDATINVLFGQ